MHDERQAVGHAGKVVLLGLSPSSEFLRATQEQNGHKGVRARQERKGARDKKRGNGGKIEEKWGKKAGRCRGRPEQKLWRLDAPRTPCHCRQAKSAAREQGTTRARGDLRGEAGG